MGKLIATIIFSHYDRDPRDARANDESVMCENQYNAIGEWEAEQMI